MSHADQSLSLFAESASVKLASDFIRQGAQKAGLPSHRLPELDLIVEELLMNVARYAYPPDTRGLVKITYSIPQASCLSVEIADQGVEFNPLELAPPELGASLEERAAGGLGVFLIRHYTDSLQYRRDGAWNRVLFLVRG